MQSIKNISIPSNCTLLDEFCFASCSNLKEIYIPASVTKIGSSCFTGCSGLQKVTFDPFSKLTTIEPNTFYYCASVKELVLPSSVRVIDNRAFFDMASLEVFKVLRPSSSEKQNENEPSFVGPSCFDRCKKLKSVEFPISITHIENCVFEQCKSLKKIDFSQYTKLRHIRDLAFYDYYNHSGNKTIEEIVLPPNLDNDFTFLKHIEKFKSVQSPKSKKLGCLA